MSVRASTSAQRLNDRVAFARPTRDANGDVTAWTTLVRQVPAAVDGNRASGPERTVADGTRSVGGYIVWVRSDVIQRFDIRVDDRIEFGDTLLDIKDAPNQGLSGRLIPLTCEAGVNKG